MENIKQLITEEDGFYDTDLEKDDLIKLLFHYEEINGKMLKQNKKFKELFVKKSREVKELKEKVKSEEGRYDIIWNNAKIEHTEKLKLEEEIENIKKISCCMEEENAKQSATF